MGVEAYTGTLADAGLQPLNGKAPELHAVLMDPARSERYLIVREPVVAIPNGAGEFTLMLQPNDQIIPSTSYLLTAVWLDGGEPFARRDLFTFYARNGGGQVADMITDKTSYSTAIWWVTEDPGIPEGARAGDFVYNPASGWFDAIEES